MIDPSDVDAVTAQLGREPRGMVAVAHRCACGQPDVVQTAPLLPDGTPFPTMYYLTCPRLSAVIGRLESCGIMRELEQELAADTGLSQQYQAAHEDYLRERDQLGVVLALADVSAGGMPARVKCLHALVAHALAVGPGVNPIGDRALAMLADRGWYPVTAAQFCSVT